MRRIASWLIGVIAILGLIGAGFVYYVWSNVEITDYPVPPRANAAPEYEIEQSTVVTSLSIPIEEIRRGLERDLPRTLVEIDQRVEECIPRETVRVFGAKLFTTPRLGCNLVGEVRRGSIVLEGSERTLSATMPVTAEIEVRDIGDVIKRETATATAIIEMRSTLGVSRKWQLQPDIRIGYRWFEEPKIIFAGQQIKLTKFADPEFAKVLRSVEQELEAQIRRVDIRSEIAGAWGSGFETISVNRENPPVWLRLTPKQAGISDLRIVGSQVTTDLMLQSDLEVFVGEEPEKPTATVLGPNIGILRGRGFEVTVPVLADYKEIEPIILRALRRLADRGIQVEELGELKVDFEEVTLYATDNGRLAVGVEAEVAPVGNITGRIWGRSRGKVWLTADPVTEPGSEVVSVTNLEIFGDMDNNVGDLLVRVIQSENVTAQIQRELVEDFTKDYDEVIGKTRNGVRSVRLGGFDLSFTISAIEHGEIRATGKGLFMPVSAYGEVKTRVRK